jgi:uncharacterized protein
MKRQPERTCIGCRGVYQKDEVVRLVAGPGSIILDYRDKLPGRAVYVCPRRECIEKAMVRDNLSRGLRIHVKPPAPEELIAQLAESIASRLRSLVSMAAKAGKLAAGYSAVHDAQEKNRIELLMVAADLADGTREKLERGSFVPARRVTMFSREEMGLILNRELIGVVAFLEKGFADAVWKESE